MNFKLLNEMIDYIELNLDKNIEYKKLAKIVGINEFILQRIFVFLTDISLSEYIRKRRLSKAYEELKISNNKIIDIALKYNYESAVSFSRAFKKEFQITPSYLRKNKNLNFKQYPKLVFENNKFKNVYFEYKIETIKDIVLYCKSVKSSNASEFNYKIRKLYDEIKKDKIYKLFNEYGQYGFVIQKSEDYKYYVGCKIQMDELEKVIIPSGKYMIFKINSRNQNSIIGLKKDINESYLPSTNYEVDNKVMFEYYENNSCYMYVPIK